MHSGSPPIGDFFAKGVSPWDYSQANVIGEAVGASPLFIRAASLRIDLIFAVIHTFIDYSSVLIKPESYHTIQ